jgi:hypothetical protein
MTQSEKAELVNRLSLNVTFEDYKFDGTLLDALREICPTRVMDVVDESIHDKRCTKQFFHLDMQMSHVLEFTGDETEDRAYSKCCRAAKVLIAKLLPDGKTSVRPLDETAIEMLTNKNGSAGSIAQGSKSKQFDICLDYAHRIVRAIYEGKPFSEISIPTLAFCRAQLSKLVKDGHYNPEFQMKDRYVIGVDGGTVLVEMAYFYEVLQLFKKSLVNYSGGKSPENLRGFIRSARRRCSSWLGVDFSKFDMHVPSWVIHQVFDVLKHKYFRRCDWKVVNWIEYNFINTQMIAPNGTVVMKRKGIPSGSFLTQLVGTLCNFYMNFAGLAVLTDKDSVHEMVQSVESFMTTVDGKLAICGMGDDGLLFFNFMINKDFIDRHANVVTDLFGVTVHPDKCDSGTYRDSPSYLKREWRPEGEYQEPCSLLINLVHNERNRYYDNYSPWHILYGMYLTYEATFKELWISERMLLDRMIASGGIEQIRDIPVSELPGVLRGLGEQSLELLYAHAARLVA